MKSGLAGARRRACVLSGLLLALALVLAIFAPEFYSQAHLRGFAVDLMPRLVLAAGMTLVLLGGQIDVSIGAQFAVSGVVLGVAARAGLGMPLAVAACLGAGLLLGAWNAWLTMRLRLPAILASLATLALARGSLRWASGGAWIQDLPPDFQWYGLGQSGGERAFLVAGLGLFFSAAFFVAATRPGRRIRAAGCDGEALRRLGVRPERVLGALFLAMGLLTACAAALAFPRYPAVEIEAGLGLELEVIAGTVLGGTSIHGGRGSFLGSAAGVLLLALLAASLVFLHVDAAWERAVQGSVLLFAVVLDAAGERQR